MDLPETRPLTLGSVLAALAFRIDESLQWQVIDPARPDSGALLAHDTGLADASHTATIPLLVGCAYLSLAHTRGQAPCPLDAAALLDRATLATDYLLRAQRPSGLIDLLSTNYDSGPDTGFAVQALCTVLELGRPLAGESAAWAGLLARIEQFVRRAAVGMLRDGGFHTPNHRWVVASALAQAGALLPDLEVAPVVDAYLAEGIDIDAEGAYLERSIGVYDEVRTRFLLLLADYYDAPTAPLAVRANLTLNLHLLHGDGTAETGLSRRQDYGTRLVPLSLAACYLYSAFRESDPLFVQAARRLWARAEHAHLGNLCWLTYVMLKFGEPPASTLALPENFARLFPHNGIWRLRRGPLSASLFRDATRLLTLCYGRAQLSSLKISQTYFGVGRFVADTLEVADESVRLRSEGRSNPRRPAYELPLGRPVPLDQWEASMGERQLRPIPPCTSELIVCETAGGLDLRYRTLDGLDRVTAQAAFDFPPGGVWETDDTCFEPRAGQVIFLRRGAGAMRYGSDVIQIEPGADAHRTWHMRHAEEAPDHVRILLTFLTPVDHTIRLRVGKVLESSEQ